MSTLPPFKGALVRGATTLFGLGVKARGIAYDTGVRAAQRVDSVRVISVGNLRAGGSGKTPVAMHLAGLLRDRGEPTALLLRGYRGWLENTGGCVSEGEGPLVSAQEAGDEAFLAARRLRGVSVWVGRDRVLGARRARDAGARVVVLDDGFQHRRLHRDLDILLVCPEDLEPNTPLLPAGPLRELGAAASRAHLTGGFEREWRGRAEQRDLLIDYKPARLVSRAGATSPLSSYRGARVYLVAGVARPERFSHSAALAGYNVVGASFFTDHHRFSAKDIRKSEREARASTADVILTTEKDLPRLGNLQLGLPVWALRVVIEIRRGERILLDALDKILGAARPSG